MYPFLIHFHVYCLYFCSFSDDDLWPLILNSDALTSQMLQVITMLITVFDLLDLQFVTVWWTYDLWTCRFLVCVRPMTFDLSESCYVFDLWPLTFQIVALSLTYDLWPCRLLQCWLPWCVHLQSVGFLFMHSSLQ